MLARRRTSGPAPRPPSGAPPDDRATAAGGPAPAAPRDTRPRSAPATGTGTGTEIGIGIGIGIGTEIGIGIGIELVGIGKRFGDTVAVDGLDLSVPRNGRLGIVGPSGCGKSTVLSMICGLIEPDAGTVDVVGATTARARLAQCAWMPQRDLLLPWRSVLANARIALENAGMSGRAASDHIRPLLDRCGLADFADHRPAQLSGGMRQRVSFLRTLAADKPVLLLDEPFGALDSITRADLQDWLRAMLADQPRTVALVTHDVEEALLLCDQVVVMSPRPGRAIARVDVGAVVGAGPAGLGARDGRSRRELLADPRFVRLRDTVLGHLEAAR